MKNTASILNEVIEQHNAFLLAEIADNEFIQEFLVIECSVFNAGLVIHSADFCNDLNEDIGEYTQVFRVEELNRDFKEIKNIINKGE
ncbi:MAG: hypothetical protein R8M45_10945 [Ghiorsea sp.]